MGQVDSGGLNITVHRFPRTSPAYECWLSSRMQRRGCFLKHSYPYLKCHHKETYWSRNVPPPTLPEQLYFQYVTVFADILCTTLILKSDKDIVNISPKGKIIKLIIYITLKWFFSSCSIKIKCFHPFPLFENSESNLEKVWCYTIFFTHFK